MVTEVVPPVGCLEIFEISLGANFHLFEVYHGLFPVPNRETGPTSKALVVTENVTLLLSL